MGLGCVLELIWVDFKGKCTFKEEEEVKMTVGGLGEAGSAEKLFD